MQQPGGEMCSRHACSLYGDCLSEGLHCPCWKQSHMLDIAQQGVEHYTLMAMPATVPPANHRIARHNKSSSFLLIIINSFHKNCNNYLAASSSMNCNGTPGTRVPRAFLYNGHSGQGNPWWLLLTRYKRSKQQRMGCKRACAGEHIPGSNHTAM
jgi:hypothetical protein